MTNRSIFIYDDSLLIEIRHLDEMNNVLSKKLFKYNTLKQRVEEIHISNNMTTSKIEYEYNSERKMIAILNFIEKKSEVKPTEQEEVLETSVIMDEESVLEETEQSYPIEWKDWKEKELYSREAIEYNKHGDIKLKNITGKDSLKYGGTFSITREYDKNDNWIKLTMLKNNSHLSTVVRKIEYY